ncbi:MAG: hypothetical protein WAL85_17170 [Candidatus Korobacteraceae bacterium]
MRRILVRCIAILFVIATVISVQAQETTDGSEQTPIRKPAKKVAGMPAYMACFGDGPKWSVQFVSWGARYSGIVNQPDQDLLGGFFWLADEKAWVWQMSSGNTLTAKIRKAECTEPGEKPTLPYAATIYLPNGDILGGCCRRLRAGEGPASPQNPPAVSPPHK